MQRIFTAHSNMLSALGEPLKHRRLDLTYLPPLGDFILESWLWTTARITVLCSCHPLREFWPHNLMSRTQMGLSVYLTCSVSYMQGLRVRETQLLYV